MGQQEFNDWVAAGSRGGIYAPLCSSIANNDGRSAANDICAGDYIGTVSAADQATIAANIPSNLIHRAVLNIE